MYEEEESKQGQPSQEDFIIQLANNFTESNIRFHNLEKIIGELKGTVLGFPAEFATKIKDPRMDYILQNFSKVAEAMKDMQKKHTEQAELLKSIRRHSEKVDEFSRELDRFKAFFKEPISKEMRLRYIVDNSFYRLVAVIFVLSIAAWFLVRLFRGC